MTRYNPSKMHRNALRPRISSIFAVCNNNTTWHIIHDIFRNYHLQVQYIYTYLNALLGFKVEKEKKGFLVLFVCSLYTY